MRTLVFFFCILFSAGPSLAAGSGEDSVSASGEGPHPARLAIVAGGYGVVVTAAHLQNYNSWWKGERGAFHFADDTDRNLGADKLGHMYFTYVAGDLIGRSFVWAGLEPESAFLYGGCAALAFQLYVEVEDGFHPELGFSAGDLLADAAGAGYPLAQHLVAELEHVRPKWSFIRSERFKKGSHRTVIDDYESQYYWLSFNIRELLPSVVPSFWPSFLCVAVGYGVKNLGTPAGGEGEIYLALDYDFSQLPGEGSFLTSLKHLLNYFHFPAPTIRLSPGVVVYGFRF